MSYFVAPFEVSSKGLSEAAKVRFVHLFPAIATRHSDTMDAIFLVGGKKVTVAISCPALEELRRQRGKALSDQQLAEIAALHLRLTLKDGYDATEAELLVDRSRLQGLANQLHFL